MTTYIKLSTLECPRHAGDIALDKAGESDYAHVQWVDRPDFDSTTQRCFESAPENVEGIWRMTWTVRDATPAEIEMARLALIPPEDVPR